MKDNPKNSNKGLNIEDNLNTNDNNEKSFEERTNPENKPKTYL